MSNQSKLGTLQAGAYPHSITPAVVRLCRASAAYSAARAAMDAVQKHLDAAQLDAARADTILRDARRKLERVESETSRDAAAVALRPFLVPPSDAQQVQRLMDAARPVARRRLAKLYPVPCCETHAEFGGCCK